MKMFRAIALAGLVFAISFAAPRLTRAADAGAGAAAKDAAIAPYVSDDTFLVARLDVEKVDQDELGKLMEKAVDAMLKNLPAAAGAPVGQIKAQVMQQVGKAKQWLTDMGQAGGKQVYIVLDTEGAKSNQGPAIVVPFDNADDSTKIQGVLTQSGGGEQATEIGKAVVFAQPDLVEKLKTRVSEAKPAASTADLTKAFAAAGDAPLRLAFVPGESARKWLEENAPTLPPQLGGGDTKIFSRGVRYASIAMVQKPQSIAKVTVRCTDADQAKKLNDTLAAGLKSAKEQAPGNEDLQKAIDDVKPKLSGETVSFSVDPVAVQMGMMGVQMHAAHEAKPVQPGDATKKGDDGL